MCGLPCWGEARATGPTAHPRARARAAVQDMPLGIFMGICSINLTLTFICHTVFTVGVDPRSD